TLAVVVAFGLGLAGPGLFGDGREVQSLRAAVTGLEAQVGALQARLRASEARPAGQPSVRVAASPEPQPAMGARSADRAPAAAVDGRTPPERPAPSGRPPRGEAQDDLTSPGRTARGPAVPAPTLEGALERFHRYLGEASDAGCPGRWQRMRELAADFRAL